MCWENDHTKAPRTKQLLSTIKGHEPAILVPLSIAIVTVRRGFQCDNRHLPLDPDAADEAPVADMLTPYDQEHLVTYIRLLDAQLARADWKEAARAILHIDPDREPARARLSWESHVRRAYWMTKQGYRLLLRLSRLH
jgi:hypothetical protein